MTPSRRAQRSRRHPMPWAAALLMLLAGAASPQASEDQQGGQFVRQDGHEVHYAALNTTEIPPATARALELRRSGSRAVLVLNARRLQPEGGSRSVPAQAEIRASNLIGQQKALQPRLVEDAGVWYVLADFLVHDGETLRFDIRVTPEGAEAAIPLRFEQMFYREPQ